MSTRWYPLFQPGNPQLRVFLPNFWMKMVRGAAEDDTRVPLPNRVQFIVSMEMTKHDIKNYLKKIYNVDVVEVRTQIRMGKTKETPMALSGKGGKVVTKEDDYKIAFITLPEGQTFRFPEIYPKELLDSNMEDEKKKMAEVRDIHKKIHERTKTKPDVPGWFA